MSNCIKDFYEYELVKNCSKCGNISLKSNFHKRTLSKNGYRSECKICEKKFYIQNREKILESQKSYLQENQERKKFYKKVSEWY